MKTLKIGRDTENDIVIYDSKVSRKHLQITNNNGQFILTDLDSTNGTFVNGKRIEGKTEIFVNDVVKIGNTILSWEKFFPQEKKDKKNNKNYIKPTIGILIGLTLFTIVLIKFLPSKTSENTEKTIVKMHEKNGVRYIPVKINGQELDFIFDTGASGIYISSLEAAMLSKNGTLDENKIAGDNEFIDATGRVSKGITIHLETLQIGNKILENVEATIIENPQAECLFGQSILSQFGKYTIDNANNEIIFEKNE